MINDYTLLKAVHILMVVIWLGADVGTMASFMGLCNAKFQIPTRLGMSRLSDLMDMGPRSALVLLLMLGLYLTYRGEWGLTGGYGAVLAGLSALVGVLWFAGVWYQFWIGHHHLTGPGPTAFLKYFRIFDLYWRIGISTVLAAAAILSLFGAGPFNAAWLSWKLILFALIVMSGVYLRILIPKIGAAVGAIVKNGSTPANEAALRKEAIPAFLAVWAIWGLIGVMTVLAVGKPT